MNKVFSRVKAKLKKGKENFSSNLADFAFGVHKNERRAKEANKDAEAIRFSRMVKQEREGKNFAGVSTDIPPENQDKAFRRAQLLRTGKKKIGEMGDY